MPFTVATFLVYALIEELRNLHGKCLMCYVACLFVLHVDLVLIQLRMFNTGHKCTFAGFLLYFGAVATNTWLSVMGFDIWQTFKYELNLFLSRRRFLKFLQLKIFQTAFQFISEI